MFSNPVETGVVILGASHFDNYPDLGRQVFANAAAEANRFFRHDDYGLGIPNENILNRFNSPQFAPELQKEVFKFVEEGTRKGGRPPFKDLFVYIVTHGVCKKEYPLWLMLKSSNQHQDGFDKPDEHLEFRSLYHGIMSSALCRVYFIVDVCYSGNIAKKDLSLEKDFSDRDVYSNIRSDMMPKGGAVLFLSNNRDESGRVQADDESNLDRPLFSQVLFDILKEGKENVFSYGFSFQMLKHLCIERMEANMEAYKAENENFDPFSTNFDVLDYRQSDGTGLSNAAVFPNNDPSRADRNAIAREIRTAYKDTFGAVRSLKFARDRIYDLEELATANTDEINDLKEQLNNMTALLNETQTELVHQERQATALLNETQTELVHQERQATALLNETQTELARQEGQATALSKANRILVIFAMLAVPIICLGLVSLDPEGALVAWNNIVSLFK